GAAGEGAAGAGDGAAEGAGEGAEGEGVGEGDGAEGEGDGAEGEGEGAEGEGEGAEGEGEGEGEGAEGEGEGEGEGAEGEGEGTEGEGEGAEGEGEGEGAEGEGEGATPEDCSQEGDEDGDELADCLDPECQDDPRCSPAPCPAVDLGSAVGEKLFAGTTLGGSERFEPSCQSFGPSPEWTGRWTAPADGLYLFSTRDSPRDTVLALLTPACDGVELACSDDEGPGLTSELRVRVAAGQTLVVIVELVFGRTDAFFLSIEPTPEEPEAGRCGDLRDNDGDGFTDCADLDCLADPLCLILPEAGRCADELDNDQDGFTDCTDLDCFADPACLLAPEVGHCGDLLDNDRDGATDCGDPDCDADPACRPSCRDADGELTCDAPGCATHPRCCADFDLGMVVGPGVLFDATGNQASRSDGSCSRFVNSERRYAWTAPADGIYLFTTADPPGNPDLFWGPADTVLYLLDDCDGPELACNNATVAGGKASTVVRQLTRGRTVLLVVDTDLSGGEFQLSIHSLPTWPTLSCTDPDGDGEVCGWGGCAFDCSCVDGDAGLTVDRRVARGSTWSAGNEHTGSCGGGMGPERGYRWIAPRDGRYRFTARAPFDSDLSPVIYVRDNGCAGAELGCQAAGAEQSATVEAELDAAQQVFVIVDSAGVGDGFELGITVASERGFCTGALDEDGDWLSDCFDPDCADDPACQICPDVDLGQAHGPGVWQGNVGAASNRTSSACGGDRSGEVSFRWQAPSDDTFTFRVVGPSPAVLTVRAGECDGQELGCSSAAAGTSVALTQGQQVTVIAEAANEPLGLCRFDVLTSSEAGRCANGIDDDGDGWLGEVDCRDPDCFADPACTDFCVLGDGGSELGDVHAGSFTGTTDLLSSCPNATYLTEEDYGIAWIAPAAGRYAFEVTNPDDRRITLGLRDGGCTGPSLGCNFGAGGRHDTARLVADLDAGQRVTLILSEPWTYDDTRFQVTIHPSEWGTCANGTDDDEDGSTDCQDPDCTLAVECSGDCFQTDLGGATGDAIGSFEVSNRADERAGSCGGAGRKDQIVRWTAPRSGSFNFSTKTSNTDTAIYALAGCAGAELACNDDYYSFWYGSIFLSLAQGETIILVLEGDANGGTVVLNAR
ncbi:MAG: hypothetical protein RBU45_23155, partial [Myxococcota bacterium]|nr:hypothetical protein [Myxococcota bacterium]